MDVPLPSIGRPFVGRIAFVINNRRHVKFVAMIAVPRRHSRDAPAFVRLHRCDIDGMTVIQPALHKDKTE